MCRQPVNRSTGQPLYELYSPALVNPQEELLSALGRRQPIGAGRGSVWSLVNGEVIKTLRRERKVCNCHFLRPDYRGNDDTLREGCCTAGHDADVHRQP